MAEYGYVYKTTNLINGRIYIGQRSGAFVKHYIGSGRYFKSAVKKYGKENFKLELIIHANNRQELNNLEKKYISEYRKNLGKEKLYNITDGGEGGSFTGKHHTEEFKKKLSKALSGRIKSDKVRENISLGHMGQIRTKEAIEKAKNTLMNNPYKHDEETRKRISLSKMGHKDTIEAKEKRRKSHLKNINCQCCICKNIRNKNVCKC